MGQRIHSIDAFRGFALAGIVIVHFVERYLGSPMPPDSLDGLASGPINGIVSGMVQFFFVGKFFTLFSFLFGLSFHIQMKNGEEKGGSYTLTFAWRVILLGLIGYAHHLFYRGDILTIYALIALFIIPFYRVSSKWVMVIASLLIIGFGRFFVFYLFRGGPIFGLEIMTPDSQIVSEYFNLLLEGSWWDVALSNATEGMVSKLDFQFSIFNRGYLTFAFFLLGMLAGRIELFSRVKEYRDLIKRVTIGSIGAMILFAIGMIFSLKNAGPSINFNNLPAVVGMNFFDLFNTSLATIITGSFLLLWLNEKWGNRLNVFSPYGRMALTNYVTQSICGCFILYGYGLGWIDDAPTWALALGSILFIIIQMIISKRWLEFFHYGPLEWFWRSATLRKWQRFKRNDI